MTVTFIHFISEVIDVSTNNQLAGYKTQNHDKLLLQEAAITDAVLIEGTLPVNQGIRSLTVCCVKILYEYCL
jgi:hypothetical protein